jgi:hypothetical protein
MVPPPNFEPEDSTLVTRKLEDGLISPSHDGDYFPFQLTIPSVKANITIDDGPDLPASRGPERAKSMLVW